MSVLGICVGWYKFSGVNQLAQASPTPIPTPTRNATSNWKTYKNSDYLIEFKYPEEPLQTISIINESVRFLDIVFSKYDAEKPRDVGPANDIWIKLTIQKDKYAQALDSITQTRDFTGMDKKSIIIDNTPALIFSITSESIKQTNGTDALSPRYIVAVKKNKLIYFISLVSRSSKNYDQTFQQIISTIRFID